MTAAAKAHMLHARLEQEGLYGLLLSCPWENEIDQSGRTCYTIDPPEGDESRCFAHDWLEEGQTECIDFVLNDPVFPIAVDPVWTGDGLLLRLHGAES